MIHFRNAAIAVMCLAFAWFAYRASLAADAVTRATTEVPMAVLSIVQPALGIVDLRTQEALTIVRETAQRADALLSTTEKDAKQTVAHLAIVADGRTSDALAIVKDAAVLAVTEVQGLRADLKPTIDSLPLAVASVTALTDDAKASWDSNYDDIQAIIGSSTVAVTQAAQSAMTFNQQFPKLVDTAQETNKNFAAFTGDAHSIASGIDNKYIHPPEIKGFWNKTKAGFRLVKDISLAYLRGGR